MGSGLPRLALSSQQWDFWPVACGDPALHIPAFLTVPTMLHALSCPTPKALATSRTPVTGFNPTLYLISIPFTHIHWAGAWQGGLGPKPSLVASRQDPSPMLLGQGVRTEWESILRTSACLQDGYPLPIGTKLLWGNYCDHQSCGWHSRNWQGVERGMVYFHGDANHGELGESEQESPLKKGNLCKPG